MDQMLYKYTTLETLALILKSQKIRLNPLTLMDDLQEAENDDEIKYGNFVFISSWMDQPSESIAMWKLYSNMKSGVRIGLQRYPFIRYNVSKEDLQKVFPSLQVKVEGGCGDLIAPIEECFNDDYFIVNCAYEQSLEKVEYTDDPELLSPKMFTIKSNTFSLATAKLGKYKNTYWEFQNEERYILRFIPVDAKKMVTTKNTADVAYKAFTSKKDFIPYFELAIRDDAFYAMEITLSPQFSAGNRVLLDSLCEKFNPGVKILESALQNQVRL